MLKMIQKIKKKLQKISEFERKIDYIQQSLGRIESRMIKNINNLQDAEFRVYSQWGEDGIIQYLLNHVPIENKIFVEFGVENYTEANTRFLLQNNNWSGLVLDGSEEHISYIKNDPIYWKHNLKAECAFITRENINQLITKNGINGDIGILSVDIDGNDYWIWEAINCISPRIVICEYNSHFGNLHKISVPYDPSFVRNNKHFSNIYYGASVAALDFIAKKKGYSLIGSNMAGNNIFFVRDDLMSNFTTITPKEAYKVSLFREARDEKGHLTFNSIEKNLENISNLEVINVETGASIKIKDLS